MEQETIKKEIPPVMHMLHACEINVGELGSTVRKGTKWADRRGPIELCVCTREPENHTIVGAGVIQYVWVGQFGEMPARLLAMEHELSSRIYTGLLESMRRAYPGFAETELITVVVYKRTE